MATKKPHDNAPVGPRAAGYEQRDANIGALVQFAFWMAVVLAVTMLAMRWSFDYFKKVTPLGPPASPIAGIARDDSTKPATAGSSAPGAGGLLRDAGTEGQHVRLGRSAKRSRENSRRSRHGFDFEHGDCPRARLATSLPRRRPCLRLCRGFPAAQMSKDSAAT